MLPLENPAIAIAMEDIVSTNRNIGSIRLGEFAPLDEEVVIRRADFVKTYDRDIEENTNDEYVFIGVDVASGESNDYSVVCVRRGNVELERIKVKMKLRDFKSKLINLIEDYLYNEDIVTVNVDTTGLGFQLGQDLEDYFFNYYSVNINKVNFSYKASRNREFANIFTEMIFSFKEKMSGLKLLKIEDSTIETELTSRRYGYDFLNRYQVERKKDFVKRIGFSPDEGDAVLLAFYDADGGTLIENYSNKEDWSF